MTWQPFEETARVMLLQADEGVVMAWDQRQAQASLKAAGIDPSKARCLPEVLLRDPLPEGVHLFRGTQGFEAQYWSGPNHLRASRWWPQQPSATELAQWVQALPLQAALAELPAWSSAPAWRLRPWGQYVTEASARGEASGEARLLFLVGGAFALASGLVGGQLVAGERAVAKLKEDNTTLRAAMAPVLKQRDLALAQASEADRWASWLNAPLPIELLQQLHDSLSPLGVQLRDFELRGQSLRIGLLPPPKVPRAELLRALQASGWFTKVTEIRVESQREALWLELTVLGAAPPGVSTDAALEKEPTSNINASAPPQPNVSTQARPSMPAQHPTRQAAPVPVLPQGGAILPARPSGHSQVAPKPIGPAASAGEFPPASVFDAIK